MDTTRKHEESSGELKIDGESGSWTKPISLFDFKKQVKHIPTTLTLECGGTVEVEFQFLQAKWINQWEPLVQFLAAEWNGSTKDVLADWQGIKMMLFTIGIMHASWYAFKQKPTKEPISRGVAYV